MSLFGHNFCSQALIGKRLHSHESVQFFHLQKKFKKNRIKFETVGTCPKSHLSPKGPMGLRG